MAGLSKLKPLGFRQLERAGVSSKLIDPVGLYAGREKTPPSLRAIHLAEEDVLARKRLASRVASTPTILSSGEKLGA